MRCVPALCHEHQPNRWCPKWQEVWRDFLRDFVVEVVRRPVVAVGNSIGGYISASLAGDYPALVSGER